MKIAVWGTRHEIARTIANAVLTGFENVNVPVEIFLDTDEMFYNADIHIGYGILRGMDEVFRACQRVGKPFFHIDKGYWKPGHYDGYYRISLNGTQQTTGLAKLEPDYQRWDALGLEILPVSKRGLIPLVCGPTKHVESFFWHERHSWWETQRFCNKDLVGDYIDRPKDCGRPLQADLDKCSKVITFNSSVGWEALRQGIPVISDSNYSILGAYQKQVDNMVNMEIEQRSRFAAVLASLQLSLEEIRQGKIWQLLQNLLATNQKGV